MKVPKKVNKHCPKCKTHTEHKVKIYKKGKQRKMSHGSRRYDRKKQGYGSQPKPIQHNQVKVNKKTTPLYECIKCGHTITGKGLRLKKFEIIGK